MIPKAHWFIHMSVDAHRQLYNPRFLHCFSGEDYMGFLKQVMVSTSTGGRVEERTLKRALLKAVALGF